MGNNAVECIYHLNRLVGRAAALSYPRVHMFSKTPEKKFRRMRRTA